MLHVAGNPGIMEYRGVDTQTQKQLFIQGPFEEGTNNIGEFLALVHGLAFLKKKKAIVFIYSDSRTAMSWVRKKSVIPNLKETKNKAFLTYIEGHEMAEKQLHTHHMLNGKPKPGEKFLQILAENNRHL